MNDDSTLPESTQAKPKWQPIGATDRRVVGVLVEKAKTTPSAYPMSLNAVCTGANQKSNRVPVMDLEPDDTEESLDRLRQLGAVGVVEGYGRVSKYRHYLYEWLGVDKVELAVMAELLLRGAQTVGELRGRAARMEPIRDVAALRPIIQSLIAKGLVVSLTPEGRGQVVTHALYKPKEMEKLRAEYGSAGGTAPVAAEEIDRPAAPVPQPVRQPADSTTTDSTATEALQREISELREQVRQLRSDVDDLTSRQSRTDDDLRDLRDALGA